MSEVANASLVSLARRKQTIVNRAAEEISRLISDAIQDGIKVCLLCRTVAERSLTHKYQGEIEKGQMEVRFGGSASPDPHMLNIECRYLLVHG